MLTQILDYHSGRGIALCRVVLALIFLIVLVFDPEQPVRYIAAAYGLLGGYAALSVGLLLMVWNNWWLDYHLRFPAIVGDTAIYLIALYFTADSSNDFTSPFLSSFIFIILSATLRWGWRGMVRAALMLSILYMAAGVSFSLGGLDISPHRFGRRGVYMILLSLILVWFGLQRRVRTVGRLDLADDDTGEMPIAEIARYGMTATGSQTAVVGWWSDEDPHVLACKVADGEETIRHLPPESLTEPEGDNASLFDRQKHRLLIAAADGTISAGRDKLTTPLATFFGVGEGLAIPISSSSGKGLLILSDNPGINIDHLSMASGLAQEIAAALDRQSLSSISREAAVSQLRTTLARDLHDSVAQTLAGVRFRLDAIRKQVRSGGDPDRDFDELKASLTGEQQHLRLIIERLRRTELEPRRVTLATQMERVRTELERNWNATLKLAVHPQDLSVSIELAFEIIQIAREAVANGVRHGGARNFDFAIARTASGIDLDIRDDGAGFTGDPPPHPRTLAERSRANGGQLTIFNSKPGAHLLINLPDRNHP